MVHRTDLSDRIQISGSVNDGIFKSACTRFACFFFSKALLWPNLLHGKFRAIALVTGVISANILPFFQPDRARRFAYSKKFATVLRRMFEIKQILDLLRRKNFVNPKAN